jgi:FlaA1/EpsC-like NDP-sugar epimerase
MKIDQNKTRRKLATDLQSSCSESTEGFDIMFNLLITGGCGFIGSNFINYIFNTNKYNILKLLKLIK